MSTLIRVAEAHLTLVLGFELDVRHEKLFLLLKTPKGFLPKALEWGVRVEITVHSDRVIYFDGRLRHVISNIDSSAHTYEVELTEMTTAALPYFVLGPTGYGQSVECVTLLASHLEQRLDNPAFERPAISRAL